MKTEIRSYAAELRAVLDEDDDEQFILEGVAASYNSLSADLGGFREQIAPGAFTRSLRNADVRFLLNHNPDIVLGRTTNKTLTLQDSPKGLRFRCQLDPNNSQHRDVHASVKRGDISQCSFSFTVPANGDKWDQAEEQNGRKFVRRTLLDVDLRDCSAVTYPAYDGPAATSVAARAAAVLDTRTPEEIDAYHRLRAQQLAVELDEDHRRQAAAVGAIVAEDRRRGDINGF